MASVETDTGANSKSLLQEPLKSRPEALFYYRASMMFTFKFLSTSYPIKHHNNNILSAKLLFC